jgi:hypothetical protein
MPDNARDTARAANGQIRAFADRLDPTGAEAWEFFCECGCLLLVVLSASEFDLRQADGIWADGHAAPMRPEVGSADAGS